MIDVISSSSNPLIKQARSLRQKKGRDSSGLFLVEGILHVGEAAEADWDFEALLYCPERLTSRFGLTIVDQLREKGVRCAAVSANAFDSFTEKEHPQGIAGLVRQRLWQLVDFSASNFLVALVCPQDPGNLGTILRTIDGIGADGLLLLDGGVDPFHPSSVRASMGTIFWKPFCMLRFEEFISWAGIRNTRVIGTSARATIDYRTFHMDHRPAVLLLGSEQKGLSPEQMAVCTDLVSLPMRGRASSLNLAVAAGILLYAFKA